MPRKPTDLGSQTMVEVLKDFFDLPALPGPDVPEEQKREHELACEWATILYTDKPSGPGLWHELSPAERRETAEVWDQHTKAWYDATLDAAFWWGRSKISPAEAALLLCQLNPHDDACDPLASANEKTGPADYKKLLRAFQELELTEPMHRRLEDWLSVAERAGLNHHPWVKVYAKAVRGEAVGATSEPAQGEVRLSKLEEQIRAIEAEATKLGYPRMAVPLGGKKRLLGACKASRPDLFGGGDEPFKRAWKAAVDEERIRTANHDRYVGK